MFRLDRRSDFAYPGRVPNAYSYKVPFTEEQLRADYFDAGLSQTEVAEKYGTSQKVVWRAMAKLGMQARPPVARNQKGPANNNWRGGRNLMARTPGRPKVSNGGYWSVYAPGHPHANKSGYVLEHLKLATDARGRRLDEDECVHHVNLNKHDNSLDNLAIGTRKMHAHWHNQLDEIAVSLMIIGLVTFTVENGYVLDRAALDAHSRAARQKRKRKPALAPESLVK
jgi:hypothetical protein